MLQDKCSLPYNKLKKKKKKSNLTCLVLANIYEFIYFFFFRNDYATTNRPVTTKEKK